MRATPYALRLRRWAHEAAGGLAVLGPSMLPEQSEERRAVLRATGSRAEDVETFVALIRDGLDALREMHQSAPHAPQQ